MRIAKLTKTPTSATPRKQQPLIGLAAAIAGLAIVAVATGIIPVPEQSFHAPHWVVGLAGMAFLFAGAIILTPLLIGGFAPADQYTDAQKKAIKLMQQLLGPLLLTTFAAVPLWIGFGSGERMFSSSISFAGLMSHGPGNETTGRVLFGAAGLLIGLWAAFTWVALFRAVFEKSAGSNDEGNPV